MAALLEHEYLRTASPKDAALHLHHIALSRRISPDHITQQLLEAVKSESLPPMVYALRTSSCPDHSATVAGMRQSHSIIVRSSAIRNFRRRFRTTDCESLWRALGGTEGIVRLLTQFSVVHVKEFCKAVARCSTSKNGNSTRRTLVTDLVQTLTSGTKEQNPDERSLLHLHAKMIYTCTTNFKDAWISQQDTSDLDMAKIYETEVSLYRQQCLKSLTSCKGKLDREFGKYSPLFLSIPQEPDDGDRSISASMAFAVQIMEAVRDQGISLQDSYWLN